MSEVYLITGANSGLGLDSVRQLALMPSTKKIYMACRSQGKAEAAVKSLKSSGVDRRKLAYVHFDGSAPEMQIVKDVVDSIDEVVTGVILNAGGIGHDTSKGKAAGPNNVLDIYQINLIGHIQLVQALKQYNKLASGCTIVFSGSEAARGVPIMMISKPKLGDTTEWYSNELQGKFKGGFDPMAVYAKSKGFAALYFAEWARRNPEYKVFVVSPGGTSGTDALSAKAVPSHFKVMMPVMMPMMKAIGAFHPLEKGAERYVQALTGDDHDFPFHSGAFVASKKGTTGKMVDQTTLKTGKQYAHVAKQKAAYEALSQYVSAV